MFIIKKSELGKLISVLNKYSLETRIDSSNPIGGYFKLPRGDGSDDYCFLESVEREDQIRLSLTPGAKSFSHFDKLNTSPTHENCKKIENIVGELI